jgi:hypothetical protein
VVTSVSLDALKKRTSSNSCQKLNFDPSVVQSIAQHCTDSAALADAKVKCTCRIRKTNKLFVQTRLYIMSSLR